MDRLVSVIGPAPSELLRSELLSNLREERERVAYEIRKFQEARMPKPKRVAKGKKRKEFENLLAGAGLTMEQVREMIRKKKKGNDEVG